MILLWFIAILLIASFIYFFMFKQKKQVKSLYTYQTFDELVTATALYFKNRLYVNKRTIVSYEQLSNSTEEKLLTKRTIELAHAGSYQARQALVDEIETFLVSSAMNIKSLDDLSCIVFRDPALMSSNEKFETMMYFTYKEVIESMSPEEIYNEDNDSYKRCFGQLVDMLGLFDMKRPLKTDPKLQGYYVNDEDLTQYFTYFLQEKEIEIQIEDAVSITALLIYQRLFGFPKIDSLIYDNSIDEIEIGTCGADTGSAQHVVSPLNSIILSIKNQILRLQFLKFDSQAELENCLTALANNGDGTFTSDDGYKFTTLLGLRRITVRRPPTSDRWSVNIRKLDVDRKTNQELLLWNKVPIYGTQFVEDTLQLFAWSLIVIAWIGDQGAGKTTHVNSYTNLLEADTAVRALGNIDESQFGNRFPERDIQHYFETSRHTLHEVASLGRRTKGAFLIMMEVITAESGQEAINNFKSGYVGGMMTGHGGSAEEMIEFMAQLLAMGQNTSSQETTKICASVISICIKVVKYGDIFCFENISEVVPRSWTIDWQTVNSDNIELAQACNQKEFYENVLDPKLYNVSRLCVFNKETNTYEPNDRPSLALCAKIFFRLPKGRRKFFFNYMEKYFKVDILQELIDNKLLTIKEEEKSSWYF